MTQDARPGGSETKQFFKVLGRMDTLTRDILRYLLHELHLPKRRGSVDWENQLQQLDNSSVRMIEELEEFRKILKGLGKREENGR